METKLKRDPIYESIGCFDKNGVEIFEGDVCDTYTYDSNGNIIETKRGWVQPGWGDNNGEFGAYRKVKGKTFNNVLVVGVIGDRTLND